MNMTKTEYNTIHVWVLRNYKKVGRCEICHATTKTEWSNKNGLYRRFIREEWQEVCKPCHYNYDVNVLGKPTYKEMGSNGGKKYRPNRGFAADPERARMAGKKSKRGKVE